MGQDKIAVGGGISCRRCSLMDMPRPEIVILLTDVEQTIGELTYNKRKDENNPEEAPVRVHYRVEKGGQTSRTCHFRVSMLRGQRKWRLPSL